MLSPSECEPGPELPGCVTDAPHSHLTPHQQASGWVGTVMSAAMASDWKDRQVLLHGVPPPGPPSSHRSCATVLAQE